jgi:hypothetical protein
MIMRPASGQIRRTTHVSRARGEPFKAGAPLAKADAHLRRIALRRANERPEGIEARDVMTIFRADRKISADVRVCPETSCWIA